MRRAKVPEGTKDSTRVPPRCPRVFLKSVRKELKERQDARNSPTTRATD